MIYDESIVADSNVLAGGGGGSRFNAPTSPSSKVISTKIKPFLYYKKPALGTVALGGRAQRHNYQPSAPLQLLFPTGHYGVGIPMKEKRIADNLDVNGFGSAVICSGPEDTSLDRTQKRALQLTFIIFALFNFIITMILFFNASTVDLSKVESPSTTSNPNEPPPSEFQAISANRRSIESLNFAGIIITLAIGIASIIFESALGLSIYCLSSLLNFFLSTSRLVIDALL